MSNRSNIHKNKGLGRSIFSVLVAVLALLASRPSIAQTHPTHNAIDSVTAAQLPSATVYRIAEHQAGLWELADAAYTNPAVRQWKFSSSLTSVGASYFRRADHGQVDPRRGSGEFDWTGNADTYIKHRSSTLWGSATYISGKTDNVVWRETSDSDLLYPYLSADSVGGDFKSERYCFAGGYADQKGRWSWGVSLAYEARHEFRQVDPRPRNVCGTLDLATGVGYKLWNDYALSLGAEFRKYKQSSDIMFKSEMGSDKIFHLTGPAIRYQRFDGTGLSSHYDGYRYGLNLSLYPSTGKGAFMALSLSRFTFDKLLSDLNKLPLNSLWHNDLRGQVGWLSGGNSFSWGASASIMAYRRHGSENIFGDPASNVYPQIGSLTMYGRNYFGTEIAAMARYHLTNKAIFTAKIDAGYSRRVTAYQEPWCYERLKAANITGRVNCDYFITADWLLSAMIGWKSAIPFDCVNRPAMIATDDELRGLADIELHNYYLESHSCNQLDLSVGIARKIWHRYTLQFNASWEHLYLTGPVSSDRLYLDVRVLF